MRNQERPGEPSRIEITIRTTRDATGDELMAAHAAAVGALPGPLVTGESVAQAVVPREPLSIARQIADVLSDLDGLDREERYVEAIRVAKIVEEAGEVMEALIAYHHVNPRKPPGSIREVIKELCDVALTAKVALEAFGFDSEVELASREREVLARLEQVENGGAR